MNFFRRLFASDYMPHGHCFFWQPTLVWLHVSSDLLIALAYFLIPLALVQLVRKRRDLEFNWMYLMFGLFILSCGMTHVMAVWDIWHSAYRLEGLVKAITAAASIVTAVLLFRLLPLAMQIPSPALLRKEIGERQRAEHEVRVLNAELENRVEERTAALKRSNSALQRYAYIASHDLQEPIRTVKTMNQLLARRYQGKLDASADEYLEFVVEASDRMESLVSDLLAYASILDEELPRVTQAVSSAQVMEEVLSDMRQILTETSASVSVEDQLPVVYLNQMHLKQLFLNLIGNAVKYRNPDVAPAITVSARSNGAEVTFCVEDNGVGIPAQYATQIFEAFRRLHGKELPGSGVGLTICKEIVERYRGRIWVQSIVGKGSAFYFTLPALEGERALGRSVDHNEPVNV